MVIESLYWKEELARIAKTIRTVPKPKRWSERAVCTVERDVMLGFFIVRRMIELHKVSERITEMKIDVFGTPATKNITLMNRFSLDENYDWNAEKVEKKSVAYVCNQSIHAYLSFVFRGPDRNWSDLVVVWERCPPTRRGEAAICRIREGLPDHSWTSFNGNPGWETGVWPDRGGAWRAAQAGVWGRCRSWPWSGRWRHPSGDRGPRGGARRPRSLARSDG